MTEYWEKRAISIITVFLKVMFFVSEGHLIMGIFLGVGSMAGALYAALKGYPAIAFVLIPFTFIYATMILCYWGMSKVGKSSLKNIVEMAKTERDNQNRAIINAILKEKEILPTLIGIHPFLDRQISKTLNGEK